MEKRALEICDHAVTLPLAERLSWVAAECDGDQQLHAKVVKILAHMTAAERSMQTGGALNQLNTDYSGQNLNGYQIEGVIGRGGMGVVYLALRKQGDVEFKVAIKMIAKTGHTPSLLARFTTEQKALARLSHPYICSFIELGETPDGDPYFVMEYIEGQGILEYADQQKLTIDARIELWLKVCDAVQSSHKNLVLHRDIKPSNVLVQEDGLPKLVDFGVAKLIEDGGNSNATSVLGANLTLDYASPERLARGESSTLDDQYALVVLLHELILGAKPFDRSTHTLEQLVADVAIARPAKLVVQWHQLSAQTQRSVSELRGQSPRALRAVLASDLDAIVRKGLRPDPDQRYSTIDALISDVRRYQARLPVLAKKARRIYLLSRFIRRNRVLVGATVAVLVTLSSALVYSLVQTKEANRQLQRAQAISQFLSGVIEAPSTRWSGELRVGAGASMREVLKVAALNLHESAQLPAEVKAEIHLSLGEAFMAWDMVDDNLRELRHALTISRTQLPEDHPTQQRSRLRLAIALDIWKQEKDLAEAAQLAQESVDWLVKYAPADYRTMASAVGEIGYNASVQGDFPTAIKHYEEAIKIWYRSGGETVDPWPAIAHSLNGIAYNRIGNYKKAQQEWQVTQEILRQLPGIPMPEWAHSFYGLLRLEFFRGDAAKVRTRIQDIMQFAARSDPSHVGVQEEMTWVVLAYLLVDDVQSAGELLDELEVKQAAVPDDLSYQQSVRRARALWLVASERYDEALAIYADLNPFYASYGPTTMSLVHLGRGTALASSGKQNRAKAEANQALALMPDYVVADSILQNKLTSLLGASE